MTPYRFSGISEQSKAAVKRLKDAWELYQSERWRGAMYLGGYAIECRLKVKLMEQSGCHTLDDLANRFEAKRSGAGQPITHDLNQLILMAGLESKIKSSRERRIGEAVKECIKWTVDWRYDGSDGTKREAERFLEAVEVFCLFIDRNI